MKKKLPVANSNRITLAVVNGPNINMLGSREPEIYGAVSFDELGNIIDGLAKQLDINLLQMQSNHEGELIDFIQSCPSKGVRGIAINPGGLGHSSVALLDALLSTDLPYIEVHISNIYAREPFRHKTYLSADAYGVICGLGVIGYEYAILSLATYAQIEDEAY